MLNNTIDNKGIHRTISAEQPSIGEPIYRTNSVQIPKPDIDPPGSSGVFITTKDAYTLTDGPTIFIANDLQLFDQSTFFDTACNPFDMGETQTSTTIGPAVVGVFGCPIPEVR